MKVNFLIVNDIKYTISWSVAAVLKRKKPNLLHLQSPKKNVKLRLVKRGEKSEEKIKYTKIKFSKQRLLDYQSKITITMSAKHHMETINCPISKSKVSRFLTFPIGEIYQITKNHSTVLK